MVKRISIKKKKRYFLELQYGLYGLKSLFFYLIGYKSLESSRRFLMKSAKRKITIWIKVNFNIPIRKKAIGMRMGKGIGDTYKYLGIIYKYHTFLEVSFSNLNLNKLIILLLQKIKYKLKFNGLKLVKTKNVLY